MEFMVDCRVSRTDVSATNGLIMMYAPRQKLRQKQRALSVLKEAWCVCEKSGGRGMDV